MIAKSRFHCWGDAKRLVNASEIVIHVVNRDCVTVVFKLFRMRIREARKTTYGHAHREILPLDKRR